ncbi:alpha/beta hydrolase [Lacihabitans lacunae]|uniref:Alpha/beta hydrolase n=1 Tax=Lacihabitans lacunae TaxID=1028214 RepID=A0ABV7YYP2_9BACT
MKSISYYLTALVIKLKGIKKDFSQEPIDYLKLRKDDKHTPTTKDVLGLSFRSFNIEKSKVTEVFDLQVSSENIILFCHGGASISGPSDLHWNSLAHIVKHTKTKALLIDYPKAPEHQITEINHNIEAVYRDTLSTYDSKNIILLGDSFGATLMLLLVQSLIKAHQDLPKAIVLVSPVLDASLANPAIGEIDKTDIMLSKKGVVSAKQMCAGSIDLKSEVISPLFGSFKGFVPTYLFTATRDIMYPDSEIFVQKLKQENIPIQVFEGEGMPHIWPFLPVMSEAKKALNQIVDIVKEL